MEKENRKEHTIYFKDMLFSILYHWKALLIFGLVFGLLLGGVALLDSSDSVTLNSASMTPEREVMVKQLEDNIKRNENYITQQTTYINESILMQLDPYAAYTAGFHIFVQPAVQEEATDFNPSEGILRAYRSHLISDEVMQSISAEVDIPVDYLHELISYDTSYENCTGFTARGRTAEEAQKIADALQNQIRQFGPTAKEQVEDHELKFIPFSTGPKMDNGLYSTQTNAYQKLNTLKSTVTEATANLNRLKPTELVAGDANVLLFAAAGVVAGMCLVAAYACVVYIAGDKVYSARTLNDYTGIAILGCVCNRKYDYITRLLRKSEGRNPYGQWDAVCVNLRNRFADHKNILILGTFDAAAQKELEAVLEKAGVSCSVQGDPANSAATLEQLPQCDAVVMVQTCGLSRYEQVQWQAETVKSYEKQLLGCILING